jgi:PKD repeat protein
MELPAGPGYSWRSGSQVIANTNTVSISTPGTYIVSALLAGCLSQDSLSVYQTTNTIQAMFLASTVDTVNKPVQFVNLSEPAPVSQLWDFGDGTTSTELNPLHTFFLPTTFSVSLSVSNGMCSDRIIKELNILFKSSAPPSLQPASRLEALTFKLYPNPANNFLHVEFELNDYSHASIYLMDLSGKTVFEEHSENSKTISPVINVRELTMGLYVLKANATSVKGIVERNARFIKVD